MQSSPSVSLNTKAKMPAFGFGTWELEDGDEAYRAVTQALAAGYRLIDTAKVYGNEQSVGLAVRKSAIPREQVFITTKLWPTDFGYETAKHAFNESLSRLGLDYVDLYLMHWPGKDELRRQEAWRALEEIHKAGRAKAIGVSNYQLDHLVGLKNVKIVPAVNQIEFHPYIYEEQKPVLEYCQSHKIVVEAYSPLSRGMAVDNITAMDIAERLGKTPAQILLRWAHQHGTVPIPKSAHEDRIRQNIDIFDFELSVDDISRLDDLSR